MNDKPSYHTMNSLKLIAAQRKPQKIIIPAYGSSNYPVGAKPTPKHGKTSTGYYMKL